MGKYIDIKVSMWKRFYINECDTNEIEKIINSGATGCAVADRIEEFESVLLYDTIVYMNPNQQFGISTVEMYDGEDGNLIALNGKG